LFHLGGPHLRAMTDEKQGVTNYGRWYYRIKYELIVAKHLVSQAIHKFSGQIDIVAHVQQMVMRI
jgi:hypothetical protein